MKKIAWLSVWFSLLFGTSCKKEVIEVSIADVLDEYRKDSKQVDAKYKGKILSLKGKIFQKRMNKRGYWVLSLKDAKQDSLFVKCLFSKVAGTKSPQANTKKGQEIVVQGEFREGGVGGLLLVDCELKEQ